MATNGRDGGSNRSIGDGPWGAYVVIAGLFAIVIVFVFANEKWDEASDVTTVVSAVSGVIAALVGAYFGVRGATQSRDDQRGGTERRGSF